MIARLEGLSYSYPAAVRPALDRVGVLVAKGEFSLVAGPSAGGKSTFLRVFNGLVPQFYGGRLAGRTTVAGLDPARTPARRMATIAGLVFQEPESQSVVERVEEEVAFGMEQHGIGAAEMRRRLDSILAELEIEHLRRRALASLSGGERQRVALASVMALEPRLLLLDEPTSQLDGAGAEAVLRAVERLRQSRGTTVLLAEHRQSRLLPAVDRVLQVESGCVSSFSPREAAALPGAPPVSRLGQRLGLRPLPLTVAEASESLARCPRPSSNRAPAPVPGGEILRLEGVTVSYGHLPALREVSLSLREGEVVALVGPNGSGKSSLLRAIAGLVKPTTGAAWFEGQPAPGGVPGRTAVAGFVPQDPALALYRETVRDEVADALHCRRVGRPADDVLREWGIDALAAANPRDLSVGQQQRVAIAALLAHGPRAWLLDEPTRGADEAARAWLTQRLRDHAAGGGSAIVATHDLETAARFATRVVAVDGGQVQFDLSVEAALGPGGPMPTQVAQLVPGALTVEEVVV